MSHRNNRNHRSKRERDSEESDRDHTLIDQPPTIVATNSENTEVVSEEATLVSGGADATLVSNVSETLVSGGSETMYSDLGVLVLYRGEGGDYHNILRKTFGASNVIRFDGSYDAAIIMAREQGRHLLWIGDGYYTIMSSKHLRSRINKLVCDLEKSSDVNVVLLHRSEDQCHRLRDCPSVKGVSLGSMPKNSGAIFIHQTAYVRINASNLFSESNLIGCYNENLFMSNDPTVNQRAVCVNPDLENNNSNITTYGWAIGAGAFIILIIIIIFLVFNSRKSNSTPMMVQA